MTTKEKWNRRYRVAKENWLSSIALVGLLAVGVLWLFPATRQHAGFYIAICCYAVVMMVLDLRVSLAKPPVPGRYSSLSDAHYDLGEAFRTAMKRRRKDALDIRIIAGRMNTVSVMLGALAKEIYDGDLACHQTHITVFCVDPDYLRKLQLPNVKDTTTFGDNIEVYAEAIETNSRIFLAYNKWDRIKNQGIWFDVYHYPYLPTCYAILIGKETIFWGYYTWNDDRCDFDGPTNPCFRIDQSQDAFSDFYEWHLNRSEFLKATGRHYSVQAAATGDRPDLTHGKE